MTPPNPKSAKRVLLGEITSAHGVRGEIVVRSYTAEPEDIATYGPLENETGDRQYKLTVKRVTPKGLIAVVDGVADRTAAEKLRGTKLYVARDRLPALAPGEYYHADLIGLAAVAPDGEPIGSVIGIANYGAGDLLDIRLKGTKRSELVLLDPAFVPEVDITGGRVTVVMPVFAGDDDDGMDAGSDDERTSE